MTDSLNRVAAPLASSARVRMMLVEDSATELYLLRKMFEHAPDIEIVGEARNGLEALTMLRKVDPDIVCTDYHMPVMDGLEFILKAKAISSCPIMVLSVAVQSHQKDNIFKLLAAGAVAVLAKPAGSTTGITQDEGEQLFETIREIARAKAQRARSTTDTPGTATNKIGRALRARTTVPELRGVTLAVIGASTGGPQILAKIFSQLPASCRVPIVCVQHISSGFVEGMVSWLRHDCKLPVEIAENRAIPRPGHIYFAPDGKNLMIDERRRFLLEAGTAASLHCPGIDPLFLSVAKSHGSRALGILLSGMGRDGAVGLKALCDAGAPTIAQNEETSVIFGMPGAAIALEAARYVLSPDEIAQTISKLPSGG